MFNFKKIYIYFNLKNNNKKIILNLKIIFIFLYSYFNLINIRFLNYYNIFYNNKNKKFKNKRIKKISYIFKNKK